MLQEAEAGGFWNRRVSIRRLAGYFLMFSEHREDVSTAKSCATCRRVAITQSADHRPRASDQDQLRQGPWHSDTVLERVGVSCAILRFHYRSGLGSGRDQMALVAVGFMPCGLYWWGHAAFGPTSITEGVSCVSTSGTIGRTEFLSFRFAGSWVLNCLLRIPN